MCPRGGKRENGPVANVLLISVLSVWLAGPVYVRLALALLCPLFHMRVCVCVCVCEKQANLQHTQPCIHVHKFIVTRTTTTTAASNE